MRFLCHYVGDMSAQSFLIVHHLVMCQNFLILRYPKLIADDAVPFFLNVSRTERVASLTLKHKQTIETSTNVLITFYVDPVSLRGRHVCTIIPNCASTCDVSEFLDAEIPNAYCRRRSTLFFLNDGTSNIRCGYQTSDYVVRRVCAVIVHNLGMVKNFYKLIVENHIYKILLPIHSQVLLPTYSQPLPI